MIFEELVKFIKDRKKLTKKYRSIPEDLDTVKQVLKFIPEDRLPLSYRIMTIPFEYQATI